MIGSTYTKERKGKERVSKHKAFLTPSKVETNDILAHVDTTHSQNNKTNYKCDDGI